MNLNNYRTTVVTLAGRLPFTFCWLVWDAEWVMRVVRGAHGGELADFFHCSGALIQGAPERLMAAYLMWRGIPLPRSLAPLARCAQQPHVPPPRPGTYGNAAVARMITGGARHNSSSSSTRRTATITTLPPRSRAHSSNQGHKCARSGTIWGQPATKPNSLHALPPVHLHPPRNRQLITPTAGHQRQADYGRSGTIGGQ